MLVSSSLRVLMIPMGIIWLRSCFFVVRKSQDPQAAAAACAVRAKKREKRGTQSSRGEVHQTKCRRGGTQRLTNPRVSHRSHAAEKSDACKRTNIYGAGETDKQPEGAKQSDKRHTHTCWRSGSEGTASAASLEDSIARKERIGGGRTAPHERVALLALRV